MPARHGAAEEFHVLRGYEVSKPSLIIVILVCFWVAVLSMPAHLHAEIYKYVDKNGTIHFVDDLGRIPAEYRDQVTVYEDKPDTASQEETPTASEGNREESEDYLTEQMEELQRQEEEEAREAFERSLLTQVTIDGNHVLVPVTLGYGGREVHTKLVLDTGADLITIHQPVADKLHLPLSKRAKVQVTGGDMVDARLAQLDYVRVGPYEARGIHALIILHQGLATPHEGLLGMNFLRGLEYSVDFDNQVIRWKP
jgi:predicted aspartyl protease